MSIKTSNNNPDIKSTSGMSVYTSNHQAGRKVVMDIGPSFENLASLIKLRIAAANPLKD